MPITSVAEIYSNGKRVVSVSDRLLARSVPAGDCRLWQGYVDRDGYGNIKVAGVSMLVHRVAYTTWVAPIPTGLEVDHKCKVRNCIEPSHLEAVTQAENINRATGTEYGCCRKGHEFTEANTVVRFDHRRETESRECRTCRNIRKTRST